MERSDSREESTLHEKHDASHSSEISSPTTETKEDKVKKLTLLSNDTEDDARGEEEKINSDISWSSTSLRSDKLWRSKNIDVKRSNVSREKDEYTVQNFKHLLHEETKRLRKLCEEWVEVRLQDDTSEEARVFISQVVGQTILLLNGKFHQFHGLVLDCEKDGGDLPVKCADLHGFWDLMHIEVRDCDSRFARLEKLRANR